MAATSPQTIQNESSATTKALLAAGPTTKPTVPPTASATRGSGSVREAINEIPRNVPPSSVFIGRTAELERIRHALNSKYALVCIHGLGGIGKTALALETISRCLSSALLNSHWPMFDGFVWISARGRDIKLPDVLSTIASNLDQPGIGAQALSDQKDSIYRLFRLSRHLLVIDNFETIQDEEIVDFVNGVPEPSKVLLTSRASSFGNAYSIPLTGLGEEEFIELLRAEGDRLKLPTLSDGRRSELLAVHKATGGAPLAIKWALGQLGQRGQSLESVVNSLFDARGDIFEDTSTDHGACWSPHRSDYLVSCRSLRPMRCELRYKPHVASAAPSWTAL